MAMTQRRTLSTALATLLLGCLGLSTGCSSLSVAERSPVPHTPEGPPPTSPVPRELQMVSMPRYVIEPPDILLINAVKIVPKSPHRIEPFDGLLIRLEGGIADQPLADAYSVDPEGMVDLGPVYGKVKVVGLTIDQAQDAIREELELVLTNPEVSVSLAFAAGAQQIAGERLVALDGRVNLGTYGTVHVAGMTLPEAKQAIEERLSYYLEDPEVVVDVFSYNSKKYYVITEGGGFGDTITDLPITGNETVLDALSAIGGISQISSTKIYIARPAPNGVGCEQILPVDYVGITRGAQTATNYQLMDGDRLFIEVDPLTRFDSIIGSLTQPFERLLGFTSLGVATLNRIDRFGLGQLN
ncbi:MAG: polysaccharide biosynthesis/export family protein [Planctomycetota bacterium]